MVKDNGGQTLPLSGVVMGPGSLALGVYHNRIDYPPVLNSKDFYSDRQENNGTSPDADEDNRIHPLPGMVDRPA